MTDKEELDAMRKEQENLLSSLDPPKEPDGKFFTLDIPETRKDQSSEPVETPKAPPLPEPDVPAPSEKDAGAGDVEGPYEPPASPTEQYSIPESSTIVLNPERAAQIDLSDSLPDTPIQLEEELDFTALSSDTEHAVGTLKSRTMELFRIYNDLHDESTVQVEQMISRMMRMP